MTKDYFRLEGNPQLNKESFTFSESSKYPYFTRTVFNNGIFGYVDYLDDAHLIKGNSLAVGMMACKFFYMSHDFYAGQFTKTAFPLFEGFNEQVALWFTTWFNKSSKKYLGVLVRNFEEEFYNTTLILPFNKDGKLAIKYIEERMRELEEERMRELEEERMRELEAYLAAAGFANCDLTPEEQVALRKFSNGEVKLCVHNITDTFHVANTHNILKSDIVFGSGKTPYVTASANNNSIVSYISYKPEYIEQGNSIMIGGKTLVITYQPDDFFSNDSHNLILRPKETKGQNESCELFAVAALYKSLAPKYSWGDSISKQKIQVDKVYLPVNQDGEIDYDFMETYISAIKKQIIARLKAETAREHKAYESVING